MHLLTLYIKSFRFLEIVSHNAFSFSKNKNISYSNIFIFKYLNTFSERLFIAIYRRQLLGLESLMKIWLGVNPVN